MFRALSLIMLEACVLIPLKGRAEFLWNSLLVDSCYSRDRRFRLLSIALSLNQDSGAMHV